MTVRVETSEQEGKLIRSDGITVVCQMTENELIDSFDILAANQTVLASLHCGPFQELEVGPSPKNSGTLLLMGHTKDGYCSAVVTLDDKGLTYEGVVTGLPTAKRTVGALVVSSEDEHPVPFHSVNMGSESSETSLIAKAALGHFGIVACHPGKQVSEKSYFTFRLALPRS